jgi:hypothetical protein
VLALRRAGSARHPSAVTRRVTAKRRNILSATACLLVGIPVGRGLQDIKLLSAWFGIAKTRTPAFFTLHPSTLWDSNEMNQRKIDFDLRIVFTFAYANEQVARRTAYGAGVCLRGLPHQRADLRRKYI